MFDTFFNKRGGALEYLIILLVILSILIAIPFTLFYTGHWILGTIVCVIFSLPFSLVLFARIFKKKK